MIPVAKVKLIVDTYKNLEKALASGDIGKENFVKKSKEYSSIGEVINEGRGYINFEKEKNELEKILNEKDSDKEMIKLAENELIQLLSKKEEYEEKLSHIKEPITLSVIGCVVNGPGEASQTQIGITGGGKDDHMMYLSGLPHHKVASDQIIEEVISLVENKSKELKSN